MSGRTVCPLLSLVLAAMPGVSVNARAAQTAGRPEVTFNQDIAPLLFANCSVCHRPGGSGPFPLLTYQQARQRARQLAEVTASRFMPPWLPEPGFNHFQNERRLTAEQIGLIQAWVEQGAPQGASEPPAHPEFTQQWELGPPDLVLNSDEAFPLPADGPDVFRNFVFRVPLAEARFVTALQILPGNKRVVHHANVLLDRSGEGRRRDAREPGVGFGGMDLDLESERFEPQSHFLFWKPGSRVQPEPPGMAWQLDGETDLILNMHMQPSGRPEEIRPAIGLYFTDQPATRFPMLIQLENDRALDIPAGVSDFVVTDQLILPVGVELLAVYPHAHYLGQQLEAWADLPGGSRRWLIKIDDWDFNWQGVFRYEKPLQLPAGTLISMRYRYNNSVENIRNPNHPPRRVTAGNQSSDEMSHLWLQVLPPRREDQLRLQESLMRHRLQRYPDDAVAHANLGSVLQLKGALKAAITQYLRAIELRPGDAASLNNLGAALLQEGRPREAIAYFERAVGARADYVKALFNWGNSLLMLNRPAEAVDPLLRVLEQRPADFEVHVRLGYLYSLLGQPQDSIRHYRSALRVRPQEPDVHNDLGTVLAAEGQFEEARLEFEESLRVLPDQFQAHANLGLLAARSGRLDRAETHFVRALEIDPKSADAHNNLGIVLAQTGRLEEAAGQFQRAVELDPRHPSATVNLRRARQQLKSRPNR